MRTTRMHSNREIDPAELESRAFGFGVGMLGLAQHLKKDLPEPVINALTEHGANVGAHILEAHAVTDNQVKSYASARQAVRQSTYWLRLVHSAEPGSSPRLDPLIREAADLAEALKGASARARQRIEATKFR